LTGSRTFSFNGLSTTILYSMQPIRFLILRFSSIGDIVLTTPLVRALKNQVENSEIHYFTKPEYEEILKANPYIDKIHTLQKNLPSQLKEIKAQNIDYIIDLHHNLRTARIKTTLRNIAFSFDKLNFKKWLLVNFKVNKLPDKHIVDRYFDTIDVFDAQEDGHGLDYFIPEGDVINLNELPGPFYKGYIGFVIGAKHKTKKLTDEKIQNISKKMDYPQVLMGGPDEQEFAETLAQQNPGKIFNACGKYSINQSASLIRQSGLVITHDTGLMHIAAAFHKKIISVWGNTVPEFGMYPYMPHPESTLFEIRGLSCRPCSKLGFKKCPKKHFRCILDIDDSAVASKALQLFPKGQ